MWQKIALQSNLLKWETEKAYLVKLPKSDYTFWYPKKLCKFSGKNNYLIVLNMKDDMEINIFKSGNGRYNQTEKLDEKKISYNEFLEFIK